MSHRRASTLAGETRDFVDFVSDIRAYPSWRRDDGDAIQFSGSRN